MYSKTDIAGMWGEVLKDVEQRFPHHYAALKANGWRAGVREKRNNTFGWASNREKLVIINWWLHKSSVKENIVDTMLHEIAHALDFINRGRTDHGPKWQRLARELGCKAKAVSKKAVNVEYKFVMALHYGNTLEFVKGYHRKPSRTIVGQKMPFTYLPGRKEESLGNLWLFSWADWVTLCEGYDKSPYREYH